MNILNYLKSSGAPFSFCLAACVLWTPSAAAEVTLVEKDGWTFYADGRIGAFASLGFGDDFPLPSRVSVDVPGRHTVMGSSGGEDEGTIDAGWPSSEQFDANNKYFAMRVRSGMVANVLGFGLKRNVTDTTSIKGYLSIWSTVETKGRDKWQPVDAEAREGYFNVTGPWGAATVGRTFGHFGRMGAEIDFLYGHGYGLGLPCSDFLGPGCGHTGTGVTFPGYSAGVSYSTPNLGGLQVHAGVYDPIAYNNAWDRAPYLRPEGAVTFETALGQTGKLRFAAEGLFQPVARTALDDATMVKTNQSTSFWGVSGGARLEVGPLRLGAAAFRGRGIGLTYALQGSPRQSGSSFDSKTLELRTFTGVYGQAALVLGKLHLAAGGGSASVDQLVSDRANIDLSVIQRQIGVSAALYYHVSDSVVLGVDYFRFMARWYGAPNFALDAAGTAVLAPGVLPAEKQDLNFINAGVTYHW